MSLDTKAWLGCCERNRAKICGRKGVCTSCTWRGRGLALLPKRASALGVGAVAPRAHVRVGAARPTIAVAAFVEHSTKPVIVGGAGIVSWSGVSGAGVVSWGGVGGRLICALGGTKKQGTVSRSVANVIAHGAADSGGGGGCLKRACGREVVRISACEAVRFLLCGIGGEPRGCKFRVCCRPRVRAVCGKLQAKLCVIL